MAAILKSDIGEGGEVEMKEVYSPTKLSRSVDSSPGAKPVARDNGSASLSPEKRQGTKTPPTMNGFPRDPKVHVHKATCTFASFWGCSTCCLSHHTVAM